MTPRLRTTRWIALATAFALTSVAHAADTPKPMDRDQEIALALSACPAPVADKAGVYVLAAAGYVRVRESGNGFNAIVQHSTLQTQEPQCIDAEGSRTILPRYLKVAELRAQGKTAEEIRRFVAEAYARGVFRPPARAGVDYMLSPHNVVLDAKGQVAPFPPHVMVYAPFLTNVEVGTDQSQTGVAFVAGEGGPGALIIVPVSGEMHQHGGAP
jgi:hypothetical protein